MVCTNSRKEDWVYRPFRTCIQDTMEKDKGNDKIKEAMEKLIEMFRTGNIPPAIARTVIAREKGEQPSKHWTLGNQLLMIIAGTNDARGYKQWNQVGRQVIKGGKAFYILAPIKKTN